MQVPLISDIRNDKSFKTNLLRIVLFLVLVIILDYLLSILLLKVIERNYGLKSDADILLIGHSQLMLAIDKGKLEQSTGRKVAKYTREGVNIADRQVMLRQYFAVCKKKPAVVVLGVDPWLFTGKGLSKNSYTLFYPFMDTPVVDKYISASVPDRFDYYSHKYFRSSRFDALLIYTSLRDNMSNWANLKYGVIDTIKLNNEIAANTYRKINFEQENITIFMDMLTFLAEQKVKVILLNMPVYKPLTAAQSEANQKTLQIIATQATKYSNTTFIDLSSEFTDHRVYFFDPIHMNPEGQKAMTKAFIRLLFLHHLL
jgi:hypothetical protein